MKVECTSASLFKRSLKNKCKPEPQPQPQPCTPIKDPSNLAKPEKSNLLDIKA